MDAEDMSRKHLTTALVLILLAAFLTQNNDQNSVANKEQKTSKIKAQSLESKQDTASRDIVRYPKQVKVNPKKLKRVTDRLSYYFNCLEFQQCESIPSDDPRMYEITIGDRILDEMKSLRRKEKLSSTEFDFVVKAMKMMNGHVQSEALKFFEKLPLTEENLNHVVEGLNNSDYDVVLMEDAMPLLNRFFNEPSTSHQVVQFVSNQLTKGSYLSSEYFAKNLSSFITEDNLQDFEELMNDLPNDKHSYKYIESAVENFKLMQSGG
jgi:hypothetical protein